MITRQQARENAKTALDALARFSAVYKSPRRTFGKASPVAVVSSRSLRIVDLTRDLHDQEDQGLYVSLYVRADDGQEDAAEDTLDQLIVAAGDALRDAGFAIGESDAAPDGAPLRNIDGVFYRVERFPVTYTDYD